MLKSHKSTYEYIIIKTKITVKNTIKRNPYRALTSSWPPTGQAEPEIKNMLK